MLDGFEQKAPMQVLSAMEASSAFLPPEYLYYASMDASDSSQAFYNSFSYVVLKCSSHWDRNKYWKEDVSQKLTRENDYVFCHNQVVFYSASIFFTCVGRVMV
jgi:hypothetical protein